MSDSTPSLYEWAGGIETFERLTELFYEKVRADERLGAEPPRRRP